MKEITAAWIQSNKEAYRADEKTVYSNTEEMNNRLNYYLRN